MNLPINPSRRDDDMPAEIDFSEGKRGQFFREGARLHTPVYLDAEVQAWLTVIAARQGVAVSELANDLLKREMGMLVPGK
jgi:hypothetical protein